MSWFDNINIFKREKLQTLELKKAFEVNRIGVNGRPQPPDIDRFALLNWQRKNEVVYACIRKKVEAASDPEPIVERYNETSKSWETIPGHPLVSLLKKPNSQDTFDTFLSAWIGSEETTGDFYSEIVRSKAGLPVALYPLTPARVKVIPQGAEIAKYQYDAGVGIMIDLDGKDVLHRRKPDLLTRFYGLAPLRVAIGSVDADQSQTDFTRAFFHSDGIPSGLLHVKNKSMNEDEAKSLQQGWMRKYSRNGESYKQVAVLDQDAEFQQIGSNLKDTEADVVRMQNETRICMVFGVPPALIGAYVGLKLATTNATMKTHMTDFWNNTMSPMLKSMRVFLDWNLLPEFESIENIKAGKIRCNWDMSHVMALQEDDNARHNRARDNFTCGGWTLNQFLESTGAEPIEAGNVRLIPLNVKVVNDEQLTALAEAPPVAEPAPKQLPDGSAATATVDGDLVEEPKSKLPEGRFVSSDAVVKTDPLIVADEKAMKTEYDGPPEGIPPTEIHSVFDTNSNEPREGKGFEYEGLMLSREPNEFEKKMDLKGMVQTFESGKSSLVKILLSLRADLIKQTVAAADKLGPDDIFTLTLAPPPKIYKRVAGNLRSAFDEGTAQVKRELDLKSALPDEVKDIDFDDLLKQLTELTVSRVINEIQTRAVNLITSWLALGRSKDEIKAEIQAELEAQSTNYIDGYAGAAVNSAVNKGRDFAGADQKEAWKYVEYSALLDSSCCDICSAADGERAQDVADLDPTPNPGCEGGDRCRCFHVYISI